MTSDALLDAAIQHHLAGRLAQAEPIYRQILAREPNQPDALHLLGIIALDTGHAQVATDLIAHAVRVNPSAGPYRASLGKALAYSGRVEEGLASCRAAVAMQPGNPSVWNVLGMVLLREQRTHEGLEAIEKALALQPDFVDAANNKSAALRDLGRPEEALAQAKHALELQPDSSAALVNVGTALYDLSRPEEAVQMYDRAIAAIAAAGGHFSSTARVNRAMSLLSMGRLNEGFAEYEFRPPPPVLRPGDLKAPRWDGSPLDGKLILLRTEQGFGDAIQFVRYARHVAERGGRVVLAAQAALHEFLKTAAGVECLATMPMLDQVAVQCPLMSLPHVLGTNTFEDIPADVPYLSADPQRIEQWSQRIGPGDGKLRVGIAWTPVVRGGEPRKRTCPPSEWQRLMKIDGVRWYSLQKDRPSGDEHDVPGLIDLTTELRDFADTAALVHHLDLVISVDTAVCHVAGALAKPTWMMLASAADWRWFRGRDDSPWYPTMRLFRQPSLNDWAGVVDRIYVELEKLARGRA